MNLEWNDTLRSGEKDQTSIEISFNALYVEEGNICHRYFLQFTNSIK